MAIAVTGIATFALLGAILALYGPLLPGFQRAFGVDTATVGLVFTAHGVGALLGILAPSLPAARTLAPRWLGIATGLLATGASVVYVAPSWPALLAGICVLGLGFGIHVVRLNSIFVEGFGTRGMTMSQLINAAFSIGAVAGPLLLALWGEPSQALFIAIAGVALALFPASVLTDARTRGTAVAAPAEVHAERVSASERRRAHALLAGFAAMMALTVGVENAIGGWTATVALAHGYTFSGAANLTGAFFGCIFAGRLLAAALGHRAAAPTLVLAGLTGIAALVVIAAIAGGGPVPMVVAGLAIAPLFSATLLWLRGALPKAQHANAVVIAGALLGSAVFPPLVGAAIGRFGAAVAAPALLSIALAALAIALALRRGGGQSGPY